MFSELHGVSLSLPVWSYFGGLDRTIGSLKSQRYKTCLWYLNSKWTFTSDFQFTNLIHFIQFIFRNNRSVRCSIGGTHMRQLWLHSGREKDPTVFLLSLPSSFSSSKLCLTLAKVQSLICTYKKDMTGESQNTVLTQQ